MIELASYPELAAVVRQWTADGEMDFRWPADNEDLWENAARHWRVHPGSPLLNLAHMSERPESSIKEAIGSIREANEGVAIESFLEYWKAVPQRNAADLVRACDSLKEAMLYTHGLIDLYKRSILTALEALKEALDKNDGFDWWPWNDRVEEDRKARALVNDFDENHRNLHASYMQELSQKWNENKPDISVLQQIARPIPKDLQFDK
ncbi:hypothetical protein [Nonomuraea cavernae]|uniref:Uncharacterized protein n=1 Tax=Nonomuraea cavernae TaxID=2045107 RepID=A0A917YNK4_9ACTN|nr:hypothetical protein [Nonomuraea cavernae]MCA2183741.1 hypothetical protein [Nonomuraea cavernae]GGO61225.1 hypothetical protein GCM10012289_02950 [Nonomuraea cavernae]